MAVPPKRPRADETELIIPHGVLRINVGGKLFETTADTLASSEFFRALSAFPSSPREVSGQAIFVDRGPALFEIILQALRTFERPPPVQLKELGEKLLLECGFFGIPWLEADLLGVIGTHRLRPQDKAIQEREVAGAVVEEVFASHLQPRRPAWLG